MRELNKKDYKTKLLLQVHDELIFEAPKEEIEMLEKIVPEVMENAIELNVPLKVDYSYGETWYDAKNKEVTEMPELPEVEGVVRALTPM